MSSRRLQSVPGSTTLAAAGRLATCRRSVAFTGSLVTAHGASGDAPRRREAEEDPLERDILSQTQFSHAKIVPRTRTNALQKASFLDAKHGKLPKRSWAI